MILLFCQKNLEIFLAKFWAFYFNKKFIYYIFVYKRKEDKILQQTDTFFILVQRDKNGQIEYYGYDLNRMELGWFFFNKRKDAYLFSTYEAAQNVKQSIINVHSLFVKQIWIEKVVVSYALEGTITEL